MGALCWIRSHSTAIGATGSRWWASWTKTQGERGLQMDTIMIMCRHPARPLGRPVRSEGTSARKHGHTSKVARKPLQRRAPPEANSLKQCWDSLYSAPRLPPRPTFASRSPITPWKWVALTMTMTKMHNTAQASATVSGSKQGKTAAEHSKLHTHIRTRTHSPTYAER